MTIPLLKYFENIKHRKMLFKSKHKLKCHCRGLLEAYPIVHWPCSRTFWPGESVPCIRQRDIFQSEFKTKIDTSEAEGEPVSILMYCMALIR